MRIEPIQDTLLLLPDTHASLTAEGLIIPDNVRRATVTGVVVAKGPGAPHKVGGAVIPIDIEVGNRVLFQKHMGTETLSDGKKVLVIRHEHILAVIPLDVQIEWVELPPPPIPEELADSAPMDFAG